MSPRGGRLVVAHARRRTIAIATPGRGRSKVLDVGGQPVDVAISPDGRLAAVTTAFWDGPGLAIVDIHAGALRKRIDVGPAPTCVAFTPSGDRLVVSGGEQEGRVYVLDVKSLAVVVQSQIGIVPRGIAIAPDVDGGAVAWIAINGEDRVVRVDLRNALIERTLRTNWLPDRVAVSPDGRRLLVTHGGTDAAHVSEIETRSGRVHRHRAGRLPSAVAWTARGKRLVALGGESAVVAIDARGRHTRKHVGPAPRGLAVAGNRAWTVSELTGEWSGVKV